MKIKSKQIKFTVTEAFIVFWMFQNQLNSLLKNVKYSINDQGEKIIYNPISKNWNTYNSKSFGLFKINIDIINHLCPTQESKSRLCGIIKILIDDATIQFEKYIEPENMNELLKINRTINYLNYIKSFLIQDLSIENLYFEKLRDLVQSYYKNKIIN